MDKAATTESDDTAALLADIDPRAGPLIITMFGDTIAPRGGNIWLGSLIGLMSHFGISERLVRTVVFRLARDGWFETRSAGRRSFYELTQQSRTTFAEADQRIYTASLPSWDGSWTLVQALPDLPAKDRQQLRDTLKWYGFGQLSPSLMIHPRTSNPAPFNGADHTGSVVFQARQEDFAGTASPTDIAGAAWNIAGLSTAYATLIQRFSPFIKIIPAKPAHCFVLRTLLIHEYRRILLKDPQLPAALTPPDWPGGEARNLAAELYHLVTPATDEFIVENMECWSGGCPDPVPAYNERFADSH
ncbi:MAG: phenylacetic acid degradation operon negative regulatory protein PaaX [Hyphomicrobiales bacterium]|nr:phenylacetic acid degradation operon negative regulatory protein PaaX [Hyphomicrobiales bacterium]